MPLVRYQIRNEFRLADPEVYRDADRDDPEALLEGVAMAGLIGILRQLGDLADFAAEIFHDLHEEVMSTAARGHGLMVRVQQLEAEFPSIEKAFLSQTSHQHLAHSAGLDWHPSIRIDKNLVTQGDLPRFIRDSYEECRGPPRFFLLDKFDVAGAGACLKRYSDPSFFKADLSSEAMKTDETQREKKARKIKKKGWCLRNGKTAIFLSSSHAGSKLYHLFATSDEQNQISAYTPTHGVNLKTRQLVGSPFSNSRTRRSYMESVLEIQSPESKFACESSVNSAHMKKKPSYEECEMVHEDSSHTLLHENRTHISCLGEGREVAACTSGDLDNNLIEERILESFLPISKFEEEKVPTAFSHVDQKDILVDGESKMGASADGVWSDGMTSEPENYVDALTTMETEIETDSESRAKHELGLNIKHRRMDSDTNEEHELPAQCSDSLSVENSVASCDWNKSWKKGRSSFSNSDSSNFTDMQPSQVATVAPDFPVNSENFLRLEHASSSLAYDNPCFESVENDPSLDNETFSAENNEVNLNMQSTSNGILGTKSCVLLDLYGSGNEVTGTPSYCSQIGEASSESSITDLASNVEHLRKNTSVVKLSRSHSTEIFLSCPETSKAEKETTTSSTEASKAEEETTSNTESSETEEGTSPSHAEASEAGETFPSNLEASKTEVETCLSLAETLKAEEDSNHLGDHLLDKSDLPSRTNHATDLDISLPRDYSEDGPTDENSTGRILHSSHSTASSDRPSRTNDATVVETSPPEEHSEDGATVENSTGRVLDSPRSMATSPEHHLRGLIEENPDAFLEGENSVPPIEKSEYSGSMEDLQRNDDFLEHKLQKPTVGTQPVQLETILFSNNFEVLLNAQPVDLVNGSALEAGCEVNGPAETSVNDIKLLEESLPCAERVSTESISENKGDPRTNNSRKKMDHCEPWSPDSAGASSYEFHWDVHPQIEQTQIPNDDMGGSESSRESDQDPKHKYPSTDIPLGQENPFEQASVAESGEEQGAVSLYEDGKSSESSDLLFERCRVFVQECPYFPEDDHSEASRKSSPLDQQSEPELELHQDPDLLVSKDIMNCEATTSPATSNCSALEPETGGPSSPRPTFSSVSLNVPMFSLLITEKIHEESYGPQPNRQVFDLPLHDSSDLDAKMEEMPPLPPLPPLEWRIGKVLHNPQSLEGEVAELPNLSAALPTIEDDKSNGNLPSENIHPPHSSATLPAIEDDESNGNLPSVRTRPKDPLIEALASHDKRKLRKVSERVRSLSKPKVDEREVLLEQIRTKSFNLKHTVVVKPNIQGPATNFNVAAILEKANAIRQAFAGSDEDEDGDNWSDA